MRQRILIVDNNLEICLMLQSFLILAGFWASTATTTEEALGKIKVEEPSLVLLDASLPDLELSSLIKQIYSLNRAIKIMLASASVDGVLEKKAVQLGASSYITKPFDLHSLRQRLQEAYLS